MSTNPTTSPTNLRLFENTHRRLQLELELGAPKTSRRKIAHSRYSPSPFRQNSWLAFEASFGSNSALSSLSVRQSIPLRLHMVERTVCAPQTQTNDSFHCYNYINAFRGTGEILKYANSTYLNPNLINKFYLKLQIVYSLQLVDAISIGWH